MIMKAAGSIFERRWWVTIPDRRSQELKLPASVDGVARSNQASLLELCSWLNRRDFMVKINGNRVDPSETERARKYRYGKEIS
jgi:hypothetical protein